MIRLILTAISLFALSSFAMANSDWQAGVYTGDVADLFVGQSPAIIAFVKAHDDIASPGAIYLSECPAGTENLCSLNQTRFILDYISAFYGDDNSQSNVASFLSGDSMPPKLLNEGNVQVGVSPDPVWGCAWRIATLLAGPAPPSQADFDNYRDDCGQLSDSDQSSAETSAVYALIPKIHAAMAAGTITYALVDDYPGSP